ncbi:unnamed protein product [Schistosoma turkestanicum]|nr:unnamed protein product [Schistosoma turkestanicum]
MSSYVCKSQAEKSWCTKASQFEFEFGLFYAWSLCVFSVICAYSILCPLITPFGLIYLILKYFVERYNLYYAYLPSRIDAHIHWLAVSCMLASVFLLQLNIFMFIVLRANTVSHALVICSLLGLIFSAILMIFTIITGWIMAGSSSARKLLLKNAHILSVNDEDTFVDQHDRYDSLKSVQRGGSHLNDITYTENGQESEIPAVLSMRRNNSEPNQFLQPLKPDAIQRNDSITPLPPRLSPAPAPPSALHHMPTSSSSTSSSSPQMLTRDHIARHSFPVRMNNNSKEQFVAPVLLSYQRRHSVAHMSAQSMITSLSENNLDNVSQSDDTLK